MEKEIIEYFLDQYDNMDSISEEEFLEVFIQVTIDERSEKDFEEITNFDKVSIEEIERILCNYIDTLQLR